jgi:hypothetical protein
MNAKMILVASIPGIGGGGVKKNSERVNMSMIYLIHCKNLCKCHSVPPGSIAKGKKEERAKGGSSRDC